MPFQDPLESGGFIDPLETKQEPITKGLGNIPIGGGDIPASLDVGSYSNALGELAKPTLTTFSNLANPASLLDSALNMATSLY